MIVKMKKTFIVSKTSDKERLLDALHELGVIHLKPVDPSLALNAEKLTAQIERLERAIQMLHAITPTGEKNFVPPIEAAERALELHHKIAEWHSHLSMLHRQAEELKYWGNIRMAQIEALRESGIVPQFYSIPAEEVQNFQAEMVHVIATIHGMGTIVVIVNRQGEAVIPEAAHKLELSSRDRISVIEEAQETEKKLQAAQEELPRLANALDDIIQARNELKVQASYNRAQNGAWAKDALFAIQGWVPADAADTLADELTSAGVDSAVQLLDPSDDEVPPTLVRYPRWVRPIKELFAILGTVPGYREYDLAPFFMLALPLFSAMLIGDTGYGLIFTLVGLLGYKKIVAKSGKPAVQLILVMGITTMIWGILTANYFGVTPVELMHAGGFDSIAHMEQGHGFWAALGTLMVKPAVFWSADPEIARNILIKLSFLFGCTHLVLAHLRQVVGLAPNIRCLAEAGWSIFLVGMLGVIWMLFFPTDPLIPSSPMLALLGGGFALVVLFSHPHKNPLKWLGIGMVANILPLISTFSDTISYIRLMAVGLASYYIASAFNGLAYQVGESSAWLIPASVLILLFAHLLNIALGLIAIFAHGVRLNMLEFSSNAGVQWQGYAYAPFARTAEHTDQ